MRTRLSHTMSASAPNSGVGGGGAGKDSGGADTLSSSGPRSAPHHTAPVRAASEELAEHLQRAVHTPARGGDEAVAEDGPLGDQRAGAVHRPAGRLEVLRVVAQVPHVPG